MATTNLNNNTQNQTGSNESTTIDINQLGQAILRTKTSLIKPYSKV